MRRGPALTAFALAAALSAAAFSQDAAKPEPPGDFIDPFAETPELPSGEGGIPDDFDKLFENSEITELDGSASAIEAAEELLKAEEGLSWSGSFTGGFDFGFTWDDYPNLGILRSQDSDSLEPKLSGTLKFDARPEAGYRVLGKLKIDSSGGFGNLAGLGIDPADYSVTTDENGNIVITQKTADKSAAAKDESVPDQNQLSLSLGVEELFSDFTWKDILFFRFGKSFVKWGKGYFWSPADILNLSSINAEDPTADRQGPVNLKMNWPFGINNLNLYLLMDGAAVWEHLGAAANAEFVLGDFELGFGGFLQQTKAPRLVATFSGSIDQVGVFGEGAVSFGSDRVFVRKSRIQPGPGEPQPGEDPPAGYVALDTFKVPLLPYLFGTAGFMYSNSDWNLNIIGQYYFNGEGYPAARFEDGTSLLDAAWYLFQNADTNGLALPADSQPEGYQAPPALGLGDLTNFGQHYAGLSLRLTELFAVKDLSLLFFWLGNMTDFSGIVSTTLSWKLFDRAAFSAGVRLTYGERGDEYTNPQALFAQDPEGSPQVPTFNLTVGFSLGGGSF